MTVCSRCGTQAQLTDRFCKKCGHRFDVNDGGLAFAERAAASASPRDDRWRNDGSTGSTGWSTSVAAPDWPILPSGVSDVASAPAEAPAQHAEYAQYAEHGAAVATTTADERMRTVARLLVRSRASEGGVEREYALNGHNIAIGRSPPCDIVLDGDQLLSRRHALMRYDGERYTIVDLGSSNGTFVNGTEIIEARPLAEGDSIVLGEHEMVYSTTPASPSASAAGAQSADVVVAHGPAPKTEPHLAVLSTTDLVAPAQRALSLADPTPAEPTIPHAEMAEVASAQDDPPTVTLVPSATSELDLVHDQFAHLLSTVEALARRADENERLAQQQCNALVEVRERLSGLITEMRRNTSETDETEALAPLIRIARQTAENSRHVDYMVQLADHAGEILDILEARQARAAAPAEALNVLVELRTWLYRLG